MDGQLSAPQFVFQPQVDDSWTIERIATECPPEGWKEVFAEALPALRTVSYGIQIEKAMGHTIYPAVSDIFHAFRMTALRDVKVVIMGQDPYPSTSYYNNRAYATAMGMSFSARTWDSVPVSLENIFKELSQSVPGFVTPDHGDLTTWAQQGVLLLNKCLTVQAGRPGSHDAVIWDGFLTKVIDAIKHVNPHCIYVMWGRDAQKIMNKLTEPSIKLIAPHPSGKSAHTGFFGCNHFNIINQELYKQGKAMINWQLPLLYKQWSQIYSAADILTLNYNAQLGQQSHNEESSDSQTASSAPSA